MRSLFIFLCFGLLVVTGTACKKQNPTRQTPPAGDYFPLSTHSYWNYVPDNNITAIHLNGQIGFTMMLGVKNYSVVYYAPGNTRVGNFWDISFFRKENGKYYQAVTNQQLLFSLDEPGYFEFAFMEDDAPVGTTWKSSVTGTHTYSNGQMQIKHEYEAILSEYLPSFHLDNVNHFSDVVKITFTMTATSYGPNNEVIFKSGDVYDKWYARNKGLIKTIQYSYPWAIKVSDFQVN